MRRSNGRRDPLMVSSDITPVMFATSARRSASATLSAPAAVISWVPLTRASPSLASSTTGSSPARASASAPGSV